MDNFYRAEKAPLNSELVNRFNIISGRSEVLKLSRARGALFKPGL